MNALSRTVALLFCGLAASWSTVLPAAAQQPAAPAEPEGPEQEPVYAAPTVPDRIGRIMAPVYVNGRGPFAFVVDTGASRSAIAPHLTKALGLEPDPALRVILRGVTGIEEVQAIAVERLQAGDIVLTNQQLPIVTPQVFAGADGILGVDGFEMMCLHADFANNRISITENGCPRLRRDWMRIPAKLHFGRLINVDAVIRSTRVHAIIDTGAQRSLGNLALLQALSLERRAEDPASDTYVIGATSHRADGNLLIAPTLHLGRAGIRNMRITFGDFSVFETWGLVDEPAILVGMDVLGSMDAVMIDYQRVELRILPKGSSGQQSFRKVYTPSRIP